MKKLLHGLPNVLNRNNSIPHVLCAILYPSHSKLKVEKQENSEIRDSNLRVQQLCAMIREERSEELSRAGMENNSARKRRAMAILKNALVVTLCGG